MEEISHAHQIYQTAKDVGSTTAIVTGTFAILRLLLRAITGSVTSREATLQQYLIRSLEAASSAIEAANSATAAASTATRQAEETRDLLTRAVAGIQNHAEVMERLIVVLNTQEAARPSRARSSRRAKTA